MTLTVTPATEERIQYLLNGGEYESVDQLLSAALDRLAVDEVVQSIGLVEFQKKLDESWAAAERGEFVSSEELEAELDEWRAKVNASL